jgi:T6SS immunity protein Tdi1, C-terminal
VEEFKQLVIQSDKARLWLLPEIGTHFKERGIRLRPGQSNSYKRAPFLGGKIEPDNFEVTDIYVHFGLLGDIARQVKDLPPGTKIHIELKGP